MATKSRLFQSHRRRFQRRVVTLVLFCGIILVIMYALVVIGTGVFVVYTQMGADPYERFRFRRFPDSESDAIARLLSGESMETEGEERQMVETAAAAAERIAAIDPRLPFDFSVNRLIRMRKTFESFSRRKREIPEESPKCKEETADEVFPTDFFTLEQRRNGAILLHFCGLCYMFVALAIVCDEFFVPSLGVITEGLEISDDVAGATFMAAGGSAPEFFTSLFGVFVTHNNVGIGTIVGSATFNILFVLSICTLFSKGEVKLTWWPMFRDIAFYVLSLLLLLLFFVDERVDWPEALALFLLYVGYGVFMKYNGIVESAVKKWLRQRRAAVGVDKSALVGEAEESSISNDEPMERTIPVLHAGAMFRTGFMHLALEPQTMAAAADSSDASSLPDRCKSIGDNAESSVAPTPMPETVQTPRPPFAKALTQPFLDAEVRRVDPPLPQIADPELSERETSRPASSIWSTPSSVNIHDHANGNARRPSHTDRKQRDTEIDTDRPVDISWPKTFRKQCVYVVLAPIMLPLYCTLPDAKKPVIANFRLIWFQQRRKMVLWTFGGSIVWIALYSYLMVWWANTIGSTMGLPNEILGLTILAAGTSIPDLITSVIVARKGLGDMAVSSSIGSNLFDICVGLPVPWGIYYAVNAFNPSRLPIAVVSNGLICSIGMLFLMLIILYSSVALFGWRMNKKFGITMMIAYLIFCFLSVLLELDFIICPLRQLTVHQSC